MNGLTLPPGWRYTSLRELAGLDGLCVDGDWVESIDQDPKGDVRLVQLADIGEGVFKDRSNRFLTASKARELGCTFLKGDDVLIARMASPIGRACIYPVGPKPAVTVVDVCIFRADLSLVEPRWIVAILNSLPVRRQIEEQASGTTRGRISGRKLSEIPLPLPPLDEQRRIVARLEALMERSRRARAELAEIPAQLAQARQSLLAAAFRGDLTTGWRKKLKTAVAPVADDGALGWSMPGGWIATKLLNLVPKGGLFDGPFGSHLKSDDYTESGVRVIRLENIRHLSFDNEKQTFISREKHRQLERHTVESGDLIFASFIFEPIRVCILPQLATKAIAKADCFCIRPDEALVDKRYLCYQLASPGVGHALGSHVHGATRPRINTTQLREVSVAWCPLDEQREIVRRLDAALARLDKVAAAHAAAVAELDRLDQALLARAFSGRLVPQSAGVATAVPGRASAPPTLKPKSYLTQLVPAILRVHGRSLALDQINSALALLHSPRAARDQVFRELGALEALEHFADWSQAHEDAALTAAINDLLKIGTLSQTKDRQGSITLHLVGKLPPILPHVEADARHLATFIERIPAPAPDSAPAARTRTPAPGPRARGQARLKLQTPV